MKKGEWNNIMFFKKDSFDYGDFVHVFRNRNVMLSILLPPNKTNYTIIVINNIYRFNSSSLHLNEGLYLIQKFLMRIKKKEIRKFLSLNVRLNFTNDSWTKFVNNDKFPVMGKFINLLREIVFARDFNTVVDDTKYDIKKSYLVTNNINNFDIDNINCFKFEDTMEDNLKMINYIQKKLISIHASDLIPFYTIYPEFLEVKNMPPYFKMFYQCWDGIKKEKYFLEYLSGLLEHSFILPEFKYSKIEYDIEDLILLNENEVEINKDDLSLYQRYIEDKNYEGIRELTDNFIIKYPYDNYRLKFNKKIADILTCNSISRLLDLLLDLYQFSCKYFSKDIFNYHLYLLIRWYNVESSQEYYTLLNPRFKFEDNIVVDVDFFEHILNTMDSEYYLIFFLWLLFDNDHEFSPSTDTFFSSPLLNRLPVEWHISYYLFIVLNGNRQWLPVIYSSFLTRSSEEFNEYDRYLFFIDYILDVKNSEYRHSTYKIESDEFGDINKLSYNLKLIESYLENDLENKDKIREIFRDTLDLFDKVKESIPYIMNIVKRNLDIIHLLLDYCGDENCEICNRSVSYLSNNFLGDYANLFLRFVNSHFPAIFDKMEDLYGFEKIGRICKSQAISQPETNIDSFGHNG